MKTISITVILIAFSLGLYSQSVPNMPSEVPAIGVNALADAFTYDNKSVGNYSAGWYLDSWDLNGLTGYISGWSGLKFFTLCKSAMAIRANGNIGIGTDRPLSKLQIVDAPRGPESEGTFNIGPFESANLRFGYTNEYSWIQSHGSKPLYINEIGNNTILNLKDGLVGIGTSSPTAKLSVNGNIRAREIKVENGNWPDYVFDPSHKLPDLSDVERYISLNQHLPDVPSAPEVKEKGLNLGEMNALLLKKVEELTLYIIEQNKALKEEKNKGVQRDAVLEELREEIETLKKD